MKRDLKNNNRSTWISCAHTQRESGSQQLRLNCMRVERENVSVHVCTQIHAQASDNDRFGGILFRCCFQRCVYVYMSLGVCVCWCASAYLCMIVLWKCFFIPLFLENKHKIPIFCPKNVLMMCKFWSECIFLLFKRIAWQIIHVHVLSECCERVCVRSIDPLRWLILNIIIGQVEK